MAPTNRASVTSSRTRSKRQAASTARVTGRGNFERSDRQKASTARVTGRGNFERADRQKASTARVTSGSPSSPTRANTSGRAPLANAGRKVAAVIGALKGVNPLGVAAATLAPRPTAAGTLTAARKRGDYKPKPPASKAEQATKSDFGKSFKAARAMGSKEFMFKGKRYNTKRKDGK